MAEEEKNSAVSYTISLLVFNDFSLELMPENL
jgi:hypothetical protein